MPELLREWKSRHISEEFSTSVDTQRCMPGGSQQVDPVQLEEIFAELSTPPIKPFLPLCGHGSRHTVHINPDCETPTQEDDLAKEHHLQNVALLYDQVKTVAQIM